MRSPSVSVVIPCYNSSKYLEVTLKSIIAQTYKNICIIAIDDGSTDNTRDILNAYRDKLTIYSHDKNMNLGVAASLNLGLQHVTTDLIAFIDHDDIWYPNKIEKQVEFINKNSNIDLVYTNGYAIDDSGNNLYKIFAVSHQENNDPGRLLLDCYIKSCSMVMLTRNIINRVGLFNERLLTADHDMWLRIQEASTLHYIDDCLVGYRVHGNQSSLKRRLWEDGFVILKDACRRYPYSLTLKMKRRSVLYYRLGEYDYKSNKKFSAICNFMMAFFCDPRRAIKECRLF